MAQHRSSDPSAPIACNTAPVISSLSSIFIKLQVAGFLTLRICCNECRAPATSGSPQFGQMGWWEEPMRSVF
jgi:hypothetical protein